MVRIIISNAVIKGYHDFQIKPPMSLVLKVTKEYGNKYDQHACIQYDTNWKFTGFVASNYKVELEDLQNKCNNNNNNFKYS